MRQVTSTVNILFTKLRQFFKHVYLQALEGGQELNTCAKVVRARSLRPNVLQAPNTTATPLGKKKIYIVDSICSNTSPAQKLLFPQSREFGLALKKLPANKSECCSGIRNIERCVNTYDALIVPAPDLGLGRRL